MGAALFAILVLGGTLASAAPANKVTAGSYPAVLTGQDVNTEHGKLARLSIGNGARYIECTEQSFATVLTEATTSITVSGGFSGCFANGLTAVPATVTMNQCDYIVEATSKTTGQISVTCPNPGEQIEVHVYENHVKHTENKPMCTYDIKPQGPLKGGKITAINVGMANESLQISSFGSEPTQLTSTVGGLAVCGAKASTETKGSMSGEGIVSARSGGVSTPLMIE
ncbi:MAG TPA: hypothetical protein VEW07_13030 [Solirubrobacterales bacterium]|nr:hypothetical protein [Solirubrobacterales bacterium]